MKNSIIFLGLVALTFTTTQAANEVKSQDLDQQEFTTLNVENTQQQNQLVFVNQETSKSIIENDSIVFDSNTVINSTNVKTVEDVIAEDKLITEAQTEVIQPLLFETTIESTITENNQIIESTVSNESLPLDFEKINHAVKSVKVYNDSAITVDLKL